MKPFSLVLMIGLMFLAGGCQSDSADVQQPPAEPEMTESELNEAMSRYLADQSRRGAVLSDQIVYPYHFRENSAALNDLGQRQVDALAAYYRESGGTLRVARGGVEQQLYDNRVATVKQALGQAGVDTAGLSVVDEAPPAGGSMSSDRAAEVLQPDDRRSRHTIRGGASDSSMDQASPRSMQPQESN